MGNTSIWLRYGFWVKIIAQVKSTLINGESPEMDNAQEDIYISPATTEWERFVIIIANKQQSEHPTII